MGGFIVFLGFLIVLGVLMITYLNSCSHSWELIEEGEILRGRNEDKIGFYVIKKCEYCHKLKKEEIMLK